MATLLTGFALLAGLVDTLDSTTVPNLLLRPIANRFYGAAPFTLTATSNSAGAITFVVVSGPATISGSVLTVTGIGTITVAVDQAATATYTAGTVVGSFVVSQAASLLTFLPVATVTFGVAPFTVDTTTLSASAVSYFVLSGPATMAGNLVTITGGGIVVLGAGQPASSNYAAATATASFLVNPATAVLTFGLMPSGYLGSQLTVSATSASTGAVTYMVLSGPASVVGALVTITGTTGTIVLEASQAATANYTAATATTTFAVGGSGFGGAFGIFGSGL